MVVENAAMVRGKPASISTSLARLLQVRLRTTEPQTAKSGVAPRSCAAIACATGTDKAMASSLLSAPSTLAKGVLTPAASQTSLRSGVMSKLRDVSTPPNDASSAHRARRFFSDHSPCQLKIRLHDYNCGSSQH